MTEYILGNPNLRSLNTKIEYTEECLEIAKCIMNPIYFISKLYKDC